MKLPVLTDQEVRAWPKNENAPRAEYIELADILACTTWECDAHFCAYSVPSTPHRLDKGAVGRIEIPMVLWIFDADDEIAHAAHEPARDSWRREFDAAFARFRSVHPAGAYHSRGGARILKRMTEPFVIRTPTDEDAWRERYARAIAHMLHFGLVCDPSCANWGRLFRAPHAVRTPGQGPENWPKDLEGL